jgi:hypothetical protein
MSKVKVLAIGALFALLVTVAVSSAGAAGGGKTETLHLFSKPVSITLTTTDGTVYRKPPYPEPKPGDVLDVNSLDYAGNHRHHAKRWSVSDHVRCVFGTGEPDCEGQVAIGGSLLIFRGDKLVAGTGRYQHATGRVLSNKTVDEKSNSSDIVVRINLGG